MPLSEPINIALQNTETWFYILQLFLNLTALQNHWGTLLKIQTSSSHPWATESESPVVVLGIAYFLEVFHVIFTQPDISEEPAIWNHCF